MRRKIKPLKSFIICVFICELIFINGTVVFSSNGWGMVGAEIDGNNKVHRYTIGNYIGNVEISSDGQYFIAEGENMLYFFNRSSKTPLWNYTSGASGNNIRSISISSDGEYFVMGSDTRWTCLFDKDNSTPLWHHWESSFTPYSVAISSDGKYFVAGTGNGSGAEGSIRFGKVNLFNRSSSVPLWSYTVGEWILSVAISSNGQYIAAGCLDNKIYLFNRNSSTPLWSYETGRSISDVAISSDGKFIVAGNMNGRVYLFNNTSNTPLWDYSTGGNYLDLAISSNGQYIVVGGIWGGNVFLFNNTSNIPIWVCSEGDFRKAVALSSDSQYIAIGNPKGKVTLLDNTSKKILWNYFIGQYLGGVVISSNGNFIAAYRQNIIYLIPTTYKPPPDYSLIWAIILVCTSIVVLAVFLYSLYYITDRRVVNI